MSANRKVLEKLSNSELENYIKPQSRYMPDAIKYAYEILESRGREFSEEEKQRINYIINTITENKEKIIHQDYKKAANLTYLSGAVAVASIIWKYELLMLSPLIISISVVTVAFIFGLGYTISRGIEWIKYLLLGIFLLGLVSFLDIFTDFANSPIMGIFNIIQFVLQLWTIIILFKIPKSTAN